MMMLIVRLVLLFASFLSVLIPLLVPYSLCNIIVNVHIVITWLWLPINILLQWRLGSNSKR